MLLDPRTHYVCGYDVGLPHKMIFKLIDSPLFFLNSIYFIVIKSKHRSATDLNHQAKFPPKKLNLRYYNLLQMITLAETIISLCNIFYLNIQGRLGIFKVDKNETYRFPRLVKSFRNPSLVIISTNSSKSSLLSWFWSNRS